MEHFIFNIIKPIIAHINLAVFALGLACTLWLWQYSRKKDSRQLRNYVPTIWTSLGILGTFVSIVYALTGKGVNLQNINQLVMSIVPAFETSIIGISGAIISSICAKIAYAREDYKADKEYRDQYKGTPEEHIGDINEHIKRLLDVTQSQHKELIDESKMQRTLGEKLITDFATSLKDFYDKLYQEEKQRAQEMVDHYLTGINQLIMSTHGTIKDKFETLFTEHSESLIKLMNSEDEKFKKYTNDIITTLNTNSQEIINTIANIGSNEIDTLGTMTDTQKELLQTVVDDNKAGLAQIVTQNNSGISSVSQDAAQNLTNIAKEFTALIGTLKISFGELTQSLPNSIEQIKQSLVQTIQKLADEKFEVLTESHKEFISGLLQQVETFDQQISKQSAENQKDWSKAVNAHLAKMLNQVDVDVKNHVTVMQTTSQGLNSELLSIIDSLKESTTNYTSIVKQITTLVNALKNETNATEVFANSITSTGTQLTSIQELLTDIANKNLQLRQELAQWKRTHKQVKVDTQNGTKECPNCKAENPIDASFCRKCATSFWECEPIDDRKSKKSGD